MARRQIVLLALLGVALLLVVLLARRNPEAPPLIRKVFPLVSMTAHR